MVEDDETKLVFNSLVKISLGNGEKVLFWRDRWIHGFTVAEIAPTIMDFVSTRAHNSRTVRQALIDNAWAADVQGDISFTAHIHIANLCLAITTAPRNEEQADQFAWPADVTGAYTAKSVY
ncbi:uncharacterized protein [Aegilops tauschii subsp. strangulata]|uniref:uncharacterized protein n=1 Tax=Aegilops tauschii subsp. strangulata TaxID=200361 RepID=UPI000989AFBE|nr:uncharacterized protein LOC109748517 [Aegilops tauschii subsp. strangulata]